MMEVPERNKKPGGEATLEGVIGVPGGSSGEECACSEGDLVQSLGWEDPLEEGKAAHSSVPAWRIPWAV